MHMYVAREMNGAVPLRYTLWHCRHQESIYSESFLVGVGISYTLAWSLTGLQASVAPNDANAEVTGLCHTDGA